MSEKKEIGQSTKSIWGGEQEHELYERSTQVPVVHSVSFGYKDIDTWHKAALGVVEGKLRCNFMRDLIAKKANASASMASPRKL